MVRSFTGNRNRIARNKVPPIKHIAVVGIVDGAKSGENLANALKKYSGYKVSYVNDKNSRLQYIQAISTANVIIISGDIMAMRKNGMLVIYDNWKRKINLKASGHRHRPGASLISMPLGRGYRRKSSGYHAIETWPLSEYKKYYDCIVPAEPDLNYPEIGHGIMPYAIDTDIVHYNYNPKDTITIGAYLGGRDSKGVNKYLVPAIEILKGEGIKINLVLNGVKHKVSHNEFMRRMGTYTLYYGQITPIGVHGRSEVEALATGVPTICHITEQSRSQAGHVTDYGSPFLRANSVADIVDIIHNIISGDIDLMAISKASREYAVKWHSYQSVAAHALKIIEQAKLNKTVRK